MTAQQFITNSKQSLTGLKVSGDDNTLLSYLNLAKNQIALDTLLWLNGETISLIEGTNEYTLSKIPIQIIDVYDDSLTLRPRNNSGPYGYYQMSPNTIYVNTPSNGVDININYYYTPDDYILTDLIDIPESILNATQYFLLHKGYEMQKDEMGVVSSKEYFARYNAAINRYLGKTDNNNVDSVLSIDLIADKGLV